MEPPVESPTYRETRERPDMLSEQSPEGLRVFQITSSEDLPSCHVYMEGRMFTADSRRFVFERHRDREYDRSRREVSDYMLCEIDDGCSFRQITDEDGVCGVAVAPSGDHLFYFIDQTVAGGGWWGVKRLDLNTLQRETVCRFENPGPAGRSLSLFSGAGTISTDGIRMCMGAYLGDGKTKNAPWGIVVIDVQQATAEVVLESQSFCNAHPQYSRSRDPEARHDILVQDNHGCDIDERGDRVKLAGGAGADVHVIRDDGSNFRSMPWGRDGVEECQGHQAWRGEMTTAVASLVIRDQETYPLVESRGVVPDEGAEHDGTMIADGWRNRISRNMEREDSCHFAFDPTGTRLISDTFGYRGRHETCEIYLGTFPDTPDAALKTRYLLHPRTSFGSAQRTHPHPFLSPDATVAFFNSDESGLPQAFMLTDFEFPG